MLTIRIKPDGRDSYLGNDYSMMVDLFNEWCFCDGGWGETNGGDHITICAVDLKDVTDVIKGLCKKNKEYRPEMLAVSVIRRD